MNDKDNITQENTLDKKDTAQDVQTFNKSHKLRRALVVYGFILVLAGWLTMMVNEWVSIGCTVIGLILSCIGVRIPAGPRRNFAITAIVAASVLILVYLLFVSLFLLI